ncbi:MAG TPA: YggT family protein [Thermodesulfobacteriota bacterium]|nr:YggT family protein [Thermodesulfobacteriota bacterium]
MLLFVRAIDFAISIYIWMIIIRAILSWVGPNSRIPMANLLIRWTDPFLWKIRSLLPMPRMGVDISPLIAIVLLEVVRYLVPLALL